MTGLILAAIARFQTAGGTARQLGAVQGSRERVGQNIVDKGNSGA